MNIHAFVYRYRFVIVVNEVCDYATRPAASRLEVDSASIVR